MRHGFGLPQVLIIILFIGGIVTVTMRYASLGAKHYADSYTREQAELFLQSATEAALLRIGDYNRSDGTCMKDLVVTSPSPNNSFEANITIERYFLANETCSNVDSTSIQSDISHGMILMRVVVTSQGTKVGNPIRLERRSLQRP